MANDNLFENVYMERCDKESENMIAEEGLNFLQQPIDHLKKHKNEFIYIEGDSFDQLGIDSLSLEIDDVFGTYEALLGLKLQKKFQPNIKDYLSHQLEGEDPKYSLMFSNEDGLWNLNFPLNRVEGFKEEMTFEEAFTLIHHFLGDLVNSVKVRK
ncbi:branched-chain amino acid aminotransferase [Peribacillus alkalitolerans]|uniref:branched-chain amino acid aminotransferase n=1 Tax=Peribacillus alkalitolerans TaxID=1550385 RepID=UPI0013D2A144|nr:branched-chain amino acid aminotransferase [Peribacillus alkalitolerans]